MVRLLRYAIVFGLLAGCSKSEQGPDDAATAILAPPKIELSDVVCLTTAWYPQTAHDEDETENRIFRELVRQGVLVAVREEMGLVTRDETLGEQFPDIPADNGAPGKRPAKALDLWLELAEDGSWEARLYGAGTTYDNPVWNHKGSVNFNKRTIYAELAEQVADLSTEIAKSLRSAGGKGDAEKFNAENVPGDEIEKLLGEMNFVSQYAAVRAAHQAIADRGASLEWLGVLARGYAHLALLTDHTWASHSEAFAARSLLYAERMLQLGEASELAQWHRAYALAVIGAHGAAIDRLAEFEKSREGKDTERPAWAELIEPYVKFEHDGLDQVANDHAELAETVAFLQWQLYYSYQHGRWIYEKGLDAMQACPEAYGVYSVMASWDALRIKRVGSGAAIAAFGALLPRRVKSLSDLPEEIKPLTTQQGGFLSKLMGRQPDPSFSDRPITIAQELMKAARDEAQPSECSWAILGQLIAEEQFVEAADALDVAGDAVEHSKSDLVEQFLPLVEGHRYSQYIKSFSFAPHEEPSRVEALSQVKVVDPKGNMKEFFHRTWRLPMADGEPGAMYSWRAVWGRNFTLTGMFESYYGSVGSWSKAFQGDHYKKFASDFHEISPYSPNALRVQWEGDAAVDMKQLAEWESQLRDDPVGWMTLGKHYYKLNEYDASARCYERSVNISPCMDATRGLADSYYNNGKKELWQPTLEAYLEVEDVGLAHAEVHQLIAQENIKTRNWKQAEPHALDAARTYSATGLLLASRVYEGMQDWEKSEYFVAEATRSYPSYWSGTEWYFWCRRTGRGDLEEAKPFAAKSIEIAQRTNYYGDLSRMFTYRYLEGEPEAALSELAAGLSTCPDSESSWDASWRQLHAVVVYGDLKNSEAKSRSLAEARATITQRIAETHPHWVVVLEGLCDALEGWEPTDDYLRKFEAVVTDGDPTYRCNYWYFLGVAYDQLDKPEMADEYLGKAAFGGPYERYNSTLAGARLFKRHGVDRGGLPETFADIEARHAAEAEAKAEEAAEEEAEVGESDSTI